MTLALTGVVRHYAAGGEAVRAVDGVTMTVRRGELVALLGPSGSGKSTVLRIAAGLEPVDHGTVTWDGEPLAALDGVRWRREVLGLVLQVPLLEPGLPARSNAAMRLIASGVRPREARRIASGALRRLGLGDRLDHRPEQLSGGERQRVALAAALSTDPALVLADEPTGALDRRRSREIAELLAETAHEGRAVLVVTHDETVAAVADRQLLLEDGHLVAMTDDGGSADVRARC